MNKLSFKRGKKPTGLASIGSPHASTGIKIDGKVVGVISAPSWYTKDVWTVMFSVEKTEPDDNPNCDWKWISLKTKFVTEEEARDFVINNIEKITSKYKVRVLE